VSLETNEIQEHIFPPKKYIVANRTSSKHKKRLDRSFSKARTRRPKVGIKKVRFLYDEFGEIEEQEKLATIELTKEDIKNAWWTRRELRDCRERAQDTCRYFLRERPDFTKAAIRLLEICGAQRSDRCKKQEGDSDTETDDDDEIVNIIIYGESRGLEKRIINALNVPYCRHKHSINRALDTQKRLREMEPGFFTNDQKTRLIASQYGLNARYAAMWARLVAAGDEKAAKQNYQ
jgi:hypothetical protein